MCCNGRRFSLSESLLTSCHFPFCIISDYFDTPHCSNISIHLHPSRSFTTIHNTKDLIRLIDLCPFLASDKAQYNEDAVLALLRQNPRAACLRHSYRCGIGSNIHPLPIIVALGASLEVVKLMVQSCPEALGERLSGKRTVLHYAISEGVEVEVRTIGRMSILLIINH